MTRILIFVDQPVVTYAWREDSRSPREVMLLINTRQLRVGCELLPLERRRQSAMMVGDAAVGEEEMVSVIFAPPPVELYPLMYAVLFGVADGKSQPEIAAQLGISEGRLRDLLAELRARFGEPGLWEVLAAARMYGLV